MRVCVGQSYSSGHDRPLSQLLPDLQLNQHGFSRAWYFSSASQDPQWSQHVVVLQSMQLNYPVAWHCLQRRLGSVLSYVDTTASPV